MKPVTTAKLVIGLIDVIKAGTVLFLLMLLEYTRSSARKKILDEKLKSIDEKPVNDSPSTIIDKYLKG